MQKPCKFLPKLCKIVQKLRFPAPHHWAVISGLLAAGTPVLVVRNVHVVVRIVPGSAGRHGRARTLGHSRQWGELGFPGSEPVAQWEAA